ncbi:hypothetical protein ACMZ6Y_01570 [Streptococcus pluranimalium]|uniref:hypothetical protein n=1 Tax=Streptococcus hyovaginalis TaxID=149015 RepID=UPI0014781D2F|nr:hypothetical protein [Streptococcus hyovaginalis]
MSQTIKGIKPVHVTINHLEVEEGPVIEVIKSEKIDQFDENTYAKLEDVSFKNGRIEVEVYSQILEDAPDFARGFIGLAFRISENDDYFESFYIRPTNGRTEDPIRRNRAIQYFAYPTYTFDYFREKGIMDYEGPADIGLDEWIHLAVELDNNVGRFYVNNDLVLTVEDLIHQPRAGNLGLFVDIGTRAYFKNITILERD